MATDNYTKKTASLKAAKIDVRKINVQGKDVATHIGQKVHTCKDTRQTVTENDLWGTYVEVTDKGNIIFHDDQVVNPNADTFYPWKSSITKVEDNKAYVGDTFYANIQTEKIKNGTSFFGCFEAYTDLTSFNSSLESLVDGSQMFMYNPKLITFDIPQMPNLKKGVNMFATCSDTRNLGTGLTTFTTNMPVLEDGTQMFDGDYYLTTFKSDLSSLVCGTYMFSGCENLTTFDSDLSSLVEGSDMFSSSGLVNFNVKELPELNSAYSMFSRTGIKEFTTNVPKLVYAYQMFAGCPIESVICDMSELRDAAMMFRNVNNTLKKLYVRFDNLISGHQMISTYNPLDVDSFMYIADSINDLVGKGYATWNEESGYWDYSDNGWNRFEYKQWNGQSFDTIIYDHPRCGSIGLYYDSELYLDGSDQANQILDYCQEIANKGWTVTLNGARNEISPTNVALIDGEQTVTPISYWYKPIPSDERFATHINANGELFEIVGGRYIFGDNLSTYGQFTSLEEAEQAMGLTKYIRPEEEKKIK